MTEAEFSNYPNKLKNILTNSLTLNEATKASDKAITNEQFKIDKFLDNIEVYFGHCRNIDELNLANNNVKSILLANSYKELQKSVDIIYIAHTERPSLGRAENLPTKKETTAQNIEKPKSSRYEYWQDILFGKETFRSIVANILWLLLALLVALITSSWWYNKLCAFIASHFQ